MELLSLIHILNMEIVSIEKKTFEMMVAAFGALSEKVAALRRKSDTVSYTHLALEPFEQLGMPFGEQVFDFIVGQGASRFQPEHGQSALRVVAVSYTHLYCRITITKLHKKIYLTKVGGFFNFLP